MNSFPTNPAVLTSEYRGETLENIYRGALVIVDSGGRVIFSRGDADCITFYRSASKPIQALPAIAAGLDLAYGLSERETVIFAGSHAGEDFHIEALESIFNKSDLREDELVMQPAYPANTAANEARIRAGLPLRKLYHNCAGKHAALMLLQRHAGCDVQDYWRAASAADAAVRHAIEVLGGQKIAAHGVDGCGVPVFATTLKSMATAYKNLARPEKIGDDALARAAAVFVPRVHNYPLFMRGTGYICGHINEDENIIAKGGAAGVYGLGLKNEGLGVAFKLESGSEAAWANVLLTVLEGLGALKPHTREMLTRLGAQSLTNDTGEVVGTRHAGFAVNI